MPMTTPHPGATLGGVELPRIMAVVNVTPDSFSDGGRWFDPGEAVRHGEELLAQGADILDVGGESTRPGAQRPSEDEEIGRVLPVVRDLVTAGASVSVDTMRASVAEATLNAGAHIINDVSGGLADERMAQVVADAGATFIAMHWRGHSVTMQSNTHYEDIVTDVVRELGEAVQQLREAGVTREKLIVDPGFGFGKTAEQNWELLSRMGEFDVDGLPVLWGTSRKTFLGRVGQTPAQRQAGEAVVPAQRDTATAMTSFIAAQHNAWGVRVHDVASTRAALDVARASGQVGVRA